MGYWRYLRALLRRAWLEAWRVVIPHSWGTIARDAAFLIVAAALLYWVEVPMIREGFTSPDNLKDTVVWAIFLVTAVATVFAAVFVAEGLFIVPYKMWREALSPPGILSAPIVLGIAKREEGTAAVPWNIGPGTIDIAGC